MDSHRPCTGSCSCCSSTAIRLHEHSGSGMYDGLMMVVMAVEEPKSGTVNSAPHYRLVKAGATYFITKFLTQEIWPRAAILRSVSESQIVGFPPLDL